MRRIGHQRRSAQEPSPAGLWRPQVLDRQLVAVTASWHERAGVVHPLPLHVWLHVEGTGPIQLATGDGGALELVAADPYRPYDLGAQGRVRVEAAQAAFPFAAHVGQEIVAIDDLGTRRFDRPLGIVVTFSSGAVAAANLGDELVVLSWPSPRLDEVGLAIVG